MAKGLLIIYDLLNLRYQVLNKERPEISTSGCNIVVGQESVACYCKDGILTFNTNTRDYKEEIVQNTFQPAQLIQLSNDVITREGKDIKAYPLSLNNPVSIFTAAQDITEIGKCNTQLLV